MSVLLRRAYSTMLPSRIQLVKQLSTDGSHYQYTLSLMGKISKVDESNYNYLKEYSYYNFNSNYKNWFELNPKEKMNFIKNYIVYHERTIPHFHKNSLRNCIKIMDKQNKDVTFMFSFIYESLKQTVDNQIDNESNFALESQVILEKDDDAADLLYKKY